MWEVSESVMTRSSPAIIWGLWKDVEHWNEWDSAINWSRIDGPFALGTRGSLKPTSGPTAAFTLTRVEEYHGFDDVTTLPLCRLEFSHGLTPLADGIRVTHTIRMSGPLTFLFSRILGRQLAHDLCSAVAKLAQLAEQRHTIQPDMALNEAPAIAPAG